MGRKPLGDAPMTGAQKQAFHRQRKKAKVAEYEFALTAIVAAKDIPAKTDFIRMLVMVEIAKKALAGTYNTDHP